MPASTTLDRGDSLWPSAVERSRRELARRDCSAWRVISGGQEIGRSRQGGKGSRQGWTRLRGLGGRWGVVSGGWDQEGSGICIGLCLLCFVAIHSASFSSASVQLPLPQCTKSSTLLFPPTGSRSLSHAERGSFWRWSATRDWAAVKPLSCAAFGVASAAPGFPNPLEY